MTPRQVQYLDKKWRNRHEREEFYSAQISATTANFSMCHPKEPLSLSDFMPTKRVTKRRDTADTDSGEDIAQRIDTMMRPRSMPRSSK